MGLAWQDAGDCRWSSSVIFSALTEQQRGYAVDRHGDLVLVADGR
jgi:hypothetical protein